MIKKDEGMQWQCRAEAEAEGAKSLRDDAVET